LSFRDVQELMLERGVDVSYETIRAGCDRFGQQYAHQLRRRGRRLGDKWHLDAVFVQINGAQRYLWRAVDQPGDVLDVLVQSRRNAVAAKKLLRRLRTGCGRCPG
jgi:putative transposase